MKIILRPGITNSKYWYPERPNKNEWNKIRKQVLERDDWTCGACEHRAESYMNIHHLEEEENNALDNLVTVCVACHAILHLGRSMALEVPVLEVWKSKISQVEIVQYTRKKIADGFSLEKIKKELPLTKGDLPPQSLEYVNRLARKAKEQARNEARAYLEEPLCAIFVNFKRWQI